MVRNRFQVQKGLAGGLLAGELLSLAPEVAAQPLPHGRGSATEPLASASGHSQGMVMMLCLAAMLAAAPGALASEIIGGLEDWTGSSGVEKNGDFNDMMFEITGNVTIDAPGGVFSNLTSSVVNESETVFWDNHSGDGSDMNIGYCFLDEAKCSLGGAPVGSLEYLATPSGGSVNNVTFDATGTVTLELLGGITGNVNTLGWYALDDPGVLHQLLDVPAYAAGATGETVSFTPDGAFALYSSDGWGQVYSSVSSSNVGESGSQEHFAYFIPSDSSGNGSSSPVPEPSTVVLTGLGAALLGFGAFRRRKR